MPECVGPRGKAYSTWRDLQRIPCFSWNIYAEQSTSNSRKIMLIPLHWQKASLIGAMKNGMVLITIMLVVLVHNVTQTQMYNLNELGGWSSIPRGFRFEQFQSRNLPVIQVSNMSCKNDHNAPISDSLLPSLQLCDFVDLEAVYFRSVSISLESHRCCADILSTTFRNLLLITHSPAIASVSCSISARARDIARATLRRNQCRINEEKQVGECGAEIGAINGAMARGLWGVEILAATAIQFHGFLIWYVGETDGEEGLLLTEYSRASSEIGALVLFQLKSYEILDRFVFNATHHLLQTTSRYNPSCVNQPVQ